MTQTSRGPSAITELLVTERNTSGDPEVSWCYAWHPRFSQGLRVNQCFDTPKISWTNCDIVLLFTVRRYALHGLSYRNSVCPSVSPSVRPSVTLVHCVHMVRPTIMISSPYGSPIILVSGDITVIPKFEGGHPERGHWMRVGWVRIGDFRPISRRISETVRDMTKVTINH